MAGISITRAFEEANALARREAALLTPVALALIVLPTVLIDKMRATLPLTPGEAMAQGFKPAMLVSPIGLFLTLLASLVISLLALRPAISVGEAFGAALRRFAVAIGASMLLGVGFALLAAPALPLMMGGAVQRLNPAFALLLLVYLVAAVAGLLFLLVRLLLLNTVVAAESLGVFASIARTWDLTRGLFWRLLGLVAAFLLVSMVATLAVVAAGGVVFLGIGRLVGDPDLGRLLVDILASTVNAAFLAWLYVFLACLYRQAAGSSRGI